jgi:hypothetical protein
MKRILLFSQTKFIEILKVFQLIFKLIKVLWEIFFMDIKIWV